MDELESTIVQLSLPQVAEAVKNLRIELESEAGEVDDEQVREIVAAAAPSGPAVHLANVILAGTNAPEEIARWGKALLRYLAADPELRPAVEEAIDDAVHSSSKDFGLSALIVLGAVVVLLKWRPKKAEFQKGRVKLEWEDNDVSVVSDLTRAVSGVSIGKPPKNEK